MAIKRGLTIHVYINNTIYSIFCHRSYYMYHKYSYLRSSDLTPLSWRWPFQNHRVLIYTQTERPGLEYSNEVATRQSPIQVLPEPSIADNQCSDGGTGLSVPYSIWLYWSLFCDGHHEYSFSLNDILNRTGLLVHFEVSITDIVNTCLGWLWSLWQSDCHRQQLWHATGGGELNQI